MHYYWWSSLSIINLNDYCRIRFLFLFHFAWVFFVFFVCVHVLWNYLFILHHVRHVFYDLQSRGFLNELQTPWKSHLPIVCQCQPIASSMLDITLALIFSQLPHPECWMPRLPLEALNCFWLALPAWFLVLAWFSCLCGGGVCLLMLFMFMCNWPLAAEVPVHCEVCVILWSFYCSYRITTVLNVHYFSTPSPGSNLTDIQHTDWF